MRNLLPLSLLLLSAPAFANPTLKGDGSITSEPRKGALVTSLEASRGVQVTVKPGPPGIVVETDQNLLASVITEVKDGTLRVTTAPDVDLKPTHGIHVTVTLASLDHLVGHGGAQLEVDVPVTHAVHIEASGGAQLSALQIDGDSLAVEASGGAQLALGGKTPKVTLNASGGVQLRAAQLAARDVQLTASGGCALDVAASDSLGGEASGGVSVRVHGKPKVSLARRPGVSISVGD